MQDGGVEVMDVDFVLDGGVAEVVGGADHLAPFDAAAGHSGAEAAWTVVAALAVLAAGSLAKLPGPNDQSLIQQAAALEVGEQGGDGLVGFAAMQRVIFAHVGVGIPILVVVTAAGIDLDKADATLNEP